MNDAAPGHRRDVLLSVWESHPDPLLVEHHGRLVDVNPATEETFGHDRAWLLGKAPTVLAAALPTGLGTSLPFRARQANGESFVASASTVVLGQALFGSEGARLTVIRNITDLISERQLSMADEMRDRERMIDAGRETLTQYLYGAGMALRSSRDAVAVSHKERERIDGAIGVLEQLMTDLSSRS